jgi:hypothetical protein
MTSDGMTHITSFMTIGSGVRLILREISQQFENLHISHLSLVNNRNKSKTPGGSKQAKVAVTAKQCVHFFSKPGIVGLPFARGLQQQASLNMNVRFSEQALQYSMTFPSGIW